MVLKLIPYPWSLRRYEFRRSIFIELWRDFLPTFADAKLAPLAGTAPMFSHWKKAAARGRSLATTGAGSISWTLMEPPSMTLGCVYAYLPHRSREGAIAVSEITSERMTKAGISHLRKQYDVRNCFPSVAHTSCLAQIPYIW